MRLSSVSLGQLSKITLIACCGALMTSLSATSLFPPDLRSSCQVRQAEARSMNTPNRRLVHGVRTCFQPIALSATEFARLECRFHWRSRPNRSQPADQFSIGLAAPRSLNLPIEATECEISEPRRLFPALDSILNALAIHTGPPDAPSVANAPQEVPVGRGIQVDRRHVGSRTSIVEWRYWSCSAFVSSNCPVPKGLRVTQKGAFGNREQSRE